MKEQRSDRDKEQTLQEYRDAIRIARNALDEMEKEIEDELGPGKTDDEN